MSCEKQVNLINRFEATIQICSNCGNKQKLALLERGYTCSNCGLALDRDINCHNIF